MEELPQGAGPSESGEAGPNPTAFWSISKLHLGMAGWTAASQSPRCWQHPLDCGDLAKPVEWLAKVLSYACAEFAELGASTG